MTADDYNKQVLLQRSQLWNLTFAACYKPGKKNAEKIAAVHADNAVRLHMQKFPLDLNYPSLQGTHVPRHNDSAASH